MSGGNKIQEPHKGSYHGGRLPRIVSTAEKEEHYKHLWGKPATKPLNWIQPQLYDRSVHYVNFYCEVCQDRGVNSKEILLSCMYCNVVCHLSCAQKLMPQTNSDNASDKWMCFYCIDYLDESRKLYENALKHSLNYDMYIRSQTLIAKYWRRYVARKFYTRIYQLILRLQIIFHVRRRKLLFLQKLQGKFRPIKLRIMCSTDLLLSAKERRRPGTTAANNGNSNHDNNSAPNTASNYHVREYTFYILISVFDTSKGTIAQTWRFQTENICMNVTMHKKFAIHVEEKMILPGISGFNVLSLSLFYKESSGRDVFLGQGTIDLALNHTWKRGGHFVLPLLDQLYPIKDPIGMDMKFEDYFASHLFQHTTPLSLISTPVSTPAANGASLLLANSTPRGYVEIDLKTYNGMTSECGYCNCSSAEEILRITSKLPDFRGYQQPAKAAAAGAKKASSMSGVVASSHSFQIPRKKAWLVVVEGLLLVYSHFGDQLKLVVDLSMFSHSLEYAGKVLNYKLNRPGYPEFQFHTVQDNDSLKWKCAFLCAVRYAKNKGTGDSNVFDVNNLLVDLVAVQALKYQQNMRNNNVNGSASMSASNNNLASLSTRTPLGSNHIRNSHQLIRSSIGAEPSLDWNKIVNCTKAILGNNISTVNPTSNTNTENTGTYGVNASGRPMTRISMINSSIDKIVNESDELALDEQHILEKLHARNKAKYSEEANSYYNKHSSSLPKIHHNNKNDDNASSHSGNSTKKKHNQHKQPQSNTHTHTHHTSHAGQKNNHHHDYNHVTHTSADTPHNPTTNVQKQQQRAVVVDKLKEALQEHFENEEIITQDKYQNVGEKFIQTLYSHTAKEKAKEFSRKFMNHGNIKSVNSSNHNQHDNGGLEEYRQSIRAQFDEF